ncbi:anti-sigma factor family protein [Streptomyces sp. NPDC059161]|uniref:anti-sigma factor family protein n=1 Tax=Streptomyces sp. NPDC059161 TaxID=3346749 RepID=UPI003680735F
MTSTTGTTQHPDVSEISELTEGILPPSRTADVRRHLQDCPLCADVRDSLEEIRDLLGTLPGPQRMPADVAGRIDAALAAEALLNATAPEDTPRETTRVSRETPAALSGPTPDPAPAAAGPDVPPIDRPAGRGRAATGPGRSAKARRRRTAVLSAVLGAAAVGAGIFFVQAAQSPSPAPRAETHSSSQPQPSGPVFAADSLQGRVQSLLTQHGGPSSQSPSAKLAPSAKKEPDNENSPDGVRSAVSVPACIQEGIGRPSTTPLAAEEGTYEGTKAYLVVLPDQANPANVEAYIVDAACVSATPPAQGKLLLTHSYPRH